MESSHPSHSEGLVMVLALGIKRPCMYFQFVPVLCNDLYFVAAHFCYALFASHFGFAFALWNVTTDV